MKNVFLYLILLIPWFLSGFLFRNCIPYFDTLNLPFFALPKPLYGIVWTILYILIAFSAYNVIKNNNLKDLKKYFIILVINYIFNQLYLFTFFCLESPFLGMINALAILITSLLLYIETKAADESANKYLKPYVIFNVYASILSIFIYFLNL